MWHSKALIHLELGPNSEMKGGKFLVNLIKHGFRNALIIIVKNSSNKIINVAKKNECTKLNRFHYRPEFQSSSVCLKQLNRASSFQRNDPVILKNQGTRLVSHMKSRAKSCNKTEESLSLLCVSYAE